MKARSEPSLHTSMTLSTCKTLFKNVENVLRFEMHLKKILTFNNDRGKCRTFSLHVECRDPVFSSVAKTTAATQKNNFDIISI